MDPAFVGPALTSVRHRLTSTHTSQRSTRARWRCCASTPPAARGAGDVQGERSGAPDGAQPDADAAKDESLPVEGAMGDEGASKDAMLMQALDRSWDKLSVLDSGGGDEPLVFTSMDERIRMPVEVQIEETISTAEAMDKELAKEKTQKRELDEAESIGGQQDAAAIGKAPEKDGAVDEAAPVAGPVKRGRGRPKKKKPSAEIPDLIVESVPPPAGDEQISPEERKPKPTKRASRSRLVSARSQGAEFLEEAKANAAIWDKDPKWFFLQVKPGCEQSCAISLRNLSRSLPQLGIREVSVPAMQIMRLTKGGKSVSKEERIYPSYILIHMQMSSESYSKVQSVPNVQFFMGDPNRDKKKNDPFMPPLPVSGSELREVFARMQSAEKAKPESRTVLRPGNIVRIVDGEYESKLGTIQEIKPEIASVTVKLRHYARWVIASLGIASVVKEDVSDEEAIAAGLMAPPVEKEESDSVDDAEESDVDDDDDGFVDAVIMDDEEPAPARGAAEKDDLQTMLKDIESEESGKASKVGADAFDDLFDDDLPDFELLEDKQKKNKDDPMQELLSLFDENEEDNEMPGEEDRTPKRTRRRRSQQ